MKTFNFKNKADLISVLRNRVLQYDAIANRHKPRSIGRAEALGHKYATQEIADMLENSNVSTREAN